MRLLMFCCGLVCSAAFAWSAPPQEDLWGYIRQKQLDRSIASGAQTYYIVMAREGTAAALIDYILSRQQPPDNEVYLALSAIGSVDRTAVPFAAVEQIVKHSERLYKPGDAFSVAAIYYAYRMAAMYGTEEALNMLKERAETAYWEGREIPVLTEELESGKFLTTNARSLALEALGSCPLPEAEEYLHDLQKREAIMADPVMTFGLKVGLRGRYHVGRQFAERQTAWELKQNGFTLNEDGYFVPLEPGQQPDPALVRLGVVSQPQDARDEAPENSTRPADDHSPGVVVMVVALLAVVVVGTCVRLFLIRK